MPLKKCYIVMFIFFLLTFVISANEQLTTEEQKTIDDFMQFRVHLTTEKDERIALQLINEYSSSILPVIVNFDDEAQLILNNFIILEKYNYMYNMDINNPNLSSLILPQKQKNDNWFSSHDAKTINKWLYCTSADVNSCCMQFVSRTEAMKIGLTVKTNYQKALEFDTNMSYALFGMGQWLIQAPGFVGGSTKKAIETFNHALASSRNKAETFYSYILLSQAYFDTKEIKKASALLEKALQIQPNSDYIAFIQLLNNNEYSLYYYVTHRKKIDAKLNIN